MTRWKYRESESVIRMAQGRLVPLDFISTVMLEPRRSFNSMSPHVTIMSIENHISHDLIPEQSRFRIVVHHSPGPSNRHQRYATHTSEVVSPPDMRDPPDAI